jgi:hypothetical protein
MLVAGINEEVSSVQGMTGGIMIRKRSSSGKGLPRIIYMEMKHIHHKGKVRSRDRA